jgi:hypothetical protein
MAIAVTMKLNLKAKSKGDFKKFKEDKRQSREKAGMDDHQLIDNQKMKDVQKKLKLTRS